MDGMDHITTLPKNSNTKLLITTAPESGLGQGHFRGQVIHCNFHWRSSFAIRKISDMLCLENGLSAITEPKPSRGSCGTWLGEDKPPAVQGQLEGLIGTALG